MKNKSISLFVGIALISSCLVAKAQNCLYNTYRMEYSSLNLQLNSAAFDSTNYEYAFAGNDEGGFLMRTDLKGAVITAKRLRGGPEISNFTAIRRAKGGGYALTGYGLFGTDIDAWVVRLKDDFTLEWAKTLTNNVSEYALDLAVNSEGAYGFCGNSDNKGLVGAVAANGNLLWAATYGAATSVKWNTIAAIQGGWVVSGVVRVNGADSPLIARLGENGEVVWAKKTPCTGAFYSVYVSPTAIYVLGVPCNTTPFPTVLPFFSIDLAGNFSWGREYALTDFVTPTSLIPLVDGFAFVGTEEGDFANSMRWVKTNLQGQQVATNSYPIPLGGKAVALTAVEDGGFLVTGHYAVDVGGTNYKSLVLKIPPDGQLPNCNLSPDLWQERAVSFTLEDLSFTTNALTNWRNINTQTTIPKPTTAEECTQTCLSICTTDIIPYDSLSLTINELKTINLPNGASYLWQPMAGVTANSPNSFTFSPTKTTAYTLYITDANGCTTTENLVVKVSQDPTGCIATNEGFTPNGDNVNDRWELPCIYSFQNKLTVYNRWGQLVYEKENYDGSWTGDYQRKSLPDGTYYYVLEVQINGKTNTQKGTVSIFR